MLPTNYRDALFIAGVTGTNLFVTFLIHWYIFVVIGPGLETDALFAGAALPQFLLSAIGGSLTQVLVPVLAGEGDEQLRQDAWSFFILVGVVFSALAILLIWSSPFWVPLLFPGFSNAGKSLAIELARIQLIAMVLTGLVCVLRAVHHARHRFFWTERSHLLELLATLGILVWALPKYGVKAAAWLSVIRAVAQTLFLLPALEVYHKPNWNSASIRKVKHRLKPLLIGALYYKSGPVVDRFLSSMAPPGGLSLFFLGAQIYGGLNDLINKTITAPMLPILSRHAEAFNRPVYRRLYQSRIMWVTYFTLAGYALLLLIGEEVLSLSVGYGGVTAENIRLLWWIMLAMGGTLIAGGMGQILAAAFYAEGNTVVPTAIGVIGFTLGAALKVIGFLQLGLVGVAIGATLHQLFNTAALYVFLEKRFRSTSSPRRVY